MLEFIKDSGTGNMVEANARLCRTEDDRLVPEGDPAARWLYTVPGRMIPRAEAEKYGLLQTAATKEPDVKVPDPPRVKVPDKPDLKAIRAWAEENELDVPKRGRIPEEVVELYNEAQED